MDILVTCPTLIKQLSALDDAFLSRGARYFAPEVSQVLGERELIELVPHYDGWIIGDDPTSEAILSAGKAGKLKACIKWGVGTDNIDYEAFRKEGVPVTNTPGVFGDDVADLAIGYVIALARQTFFIDRAIRHENAWPKPAGITLREKRILVVGAGDIGGNLIRKLAAFGMKITVADPNIPADALPEGVGKVAWPEAVKGQDFIVFTAPLNSQTFHMFDEKILPLLKAQTRLVNVGRGSVVKEDALLQGLKAGVIHSAALDVFETEPLCGNSALRDFPLCIFGSHNASNTQDAVLKVSRIAIGKLFDFLDGNAQ